MQNLLSVLQNLKIYQSKVFHNLVSLRYLLFTIDNNLNNFNQNLRLLRKISSIIFLQTEKIPRYSLYLKSHIFQNQKRFTTQLSIPSIFSFAIGGATNQEAGTMPKHRASDRVETVGKSGDPSGGRKAAENRSPMTSESKPASPLYRRSSW